MKSGIAFSLAAAFMVLAATSPAATAYINFYAYEATFKAAIPATYAAYYEEEFDAYGGWGPLGDRISLGPQSGFSYDITAPLPAGLWMRYGAITTNSSSDAMTVTFTGAPVYAVGELLSGTDSHGAFKPWGTEIDVVFGDGAMSMLLWWGDAPWYFGCINMETPIKTIVITGFIPGVWVTLDHLYVGGPAPMRFLSLSTTPGGTVSTPGLGSFQYDSGTTVSVAATAASHYHFVSWTGTAVTAGKVANPNAASTTVMMDADYTLQANFAIDTHTLTVSSTPGGLVLSPGKGTFQYGDGVQVQLQAKADAPLFKFVGWRGGIFSSSNPDSVTMNADYTVKACFESVFDVLYVDDNAPGDPGPGDPNVSDPCENGTPEHPFDMIQKAIDVAKQGAKVIVRPGTYLETIDLLGKRIEVNGLNSDDPNIVTLPIINGQGKDTVVRCTQGEDPNCILAGFVITGGWGRQAGGILCVGSDPSIMNCLIVGNRVADANVAGYSGNNSQDCVNGGALYCKDSNAVFVNCTVSGNWGVAGGPALGFKDSQVKLVNSIVWGNGPVEILASGSMQPVINYTDVAGGWLGVGNVEADPLFVKPGYWADPADLAKPMAPSDPTAVWVPGDYHLKSHWGRWDPVGCNWALDVLSSPCIDAGDPNWPVGEEPVPNGSRVNLGAYGGTSQASHSFQRWHKPGELLLP